jgi:hypothetical protein
MKRLLVLLAFLTLPLHAAEPVRVTLVRWPYT